MDEIKKPPLPTFSVDDAIVRAEKLGPEHAQPMKNSVQDIIQVFIDLFGYDQVIETLGEKAHQAMQTTRDQLATIEGGFCREVGEMVKNYPGVDIGFKQTSHGPSFTLLFDQVDPSYREEIPIRLNVIFKKYCKVRGIILQQNSGTLENESVWTLARNPDSNAMLESNQ